jgi:predicted NBD/HSP70 family sugar kinase
MSSSMLLLQGSELAKAAFDVYLDDLSTGLANLITFYNPDTIALGGGLAQAPELFTR